MIEGSPGIPLDGERLGLQSDPGTLQPEQTVVQLPTGIEKMNTVSCGSITCMHTVCVFIHTPCTYLPTYVHT